MPYRVSHDGVITCDTPDEAVALYYRLMDGPLLRRVVPSSKQDLVVAYRFLERLKEFKGQTIDSYAMRPLLEVSQLMAVGPKLRGINSALRSHGINTEDFMRSLRGKDGRTVWAIAETWPPEFDTGTEAATA